MKTICFIPSSGSCLYQYIWSCAWSLVWLQSIVADWPSIIHSRGVWVTSFPSMRPVKEKEPAVTPLHHENWMDYIKSSASRCSVPIMQSRAAESVIRPAVIIIVSWAKWAQRAESLSVCVMGGVTLQQRREEFQVWVLLCDVMLSDCPPGPPTVELLHTLTDRYASSALRFLFSALMRLYHCVYSQRRNTSLYLLAPHSSLWMFQSQL